MKNNNTNNTTENALENASTVIDSGVSLNGIENEITKEADSFVEAILSNPFDGIGKLAFKEVVTRLVNEVEFAKMDLVCAKETGSKLIPVFKSKLSTAESNLKLLSALSIRWNSGTGLIASVLPQLKGAARVWAGGQVSSKRLGKDNL
jgi:hypothetical protein